MSGLDQAIFSMFFLMVLFLAFVAFIVLAIAMVADAFSKENKKRQQATAKKALRLPVQPASVVSDKEGRVIAMEKRLNYLSFRRLLAHHKSRVLAF